jgi:hypothetical protein
MSIKYSDSGFLDGADETKKLSFDVSGVTTGTTRTITMPDANVDLSSVGTPDDNSVTLAKMAHGTDGEIITYDSSGAPATVGVGTSGQVLTSNGAGSAPSMQDAGGGKVLQVVSTTKTDTFSNSSSTLTDITGLSATITPSSTSSKILVLVSTNCSNTAVNGRVFMRLMRDATPICVGNASGVIRQISMITQVDSTNNAQIVNITNLDSPNTTSATTYKVQHAVLVSTGRINYLGGETNSTNYGRNASTITLMEIGA